MASTISVLAFCSLFLPSEAFSQVRSDHSACSVLDEYSQIQREKVKYFNYVFVGKIIEVLPKTKGVVSSLVMPSQEVDYQVVEILFDKYQGDLEIPSLSLDLRLLVSHTPPNMKEVIAGSFEYELPKEIFHPGARLIVIAQGTKKSMGLGVLDVGFNVMEINQEARAKARLFIECQKAQFKK